MGGINNKKELIERLSTSMFQGFDREGQMMTFTIFEALEYPEATRINMHINEKLKLFLMASSQTFEIGMVEYLMVVMEDLELNTAEEVGQFILHAGYMYGLLEGQITREGGES